MERCCTCWNVPTGDIACSAASRVDGAKAWRWLVCRSRRTCPRWVTTRTPTTDPSRSTPAPAMATRSSKSKSGTEYARGSNSIDVDGNLRSKTIWCCGAEGAFFSRLKPNNSSEYLGQAIALNSLITARKQNKREMITFSEIEGVLE